MAKKMIRLTESYLHRVIKESVKKILKEMEGGEGDPEERERLELLKSMPPPPYDMETEYKPEGFNRENRRDKDMKNDFDLNDRNNAFDFEMAGYKLDDDNYYRNGLFNTDSSKQKYYVNKFDKTPNMRSSMKNPNGKSIWSGHNGIK